jgi:hypothetical protein
MMLKKRPLLKIILVTLLGNFLPHITTGQVALRDTTIVWKHHRFELNADGSMKTYTTSDADIQEITFSEAKVIENEWIKLVLLPEYGGRVLSFVYKPTGYEYLYRSEVGSAYGIGQGNFYYNWLMVYGGIFPTFPEPEHGKTWFLPWDYSVVKNTEDTVTVRMSYTDNSSFSGAPGGFNNGTTDITCQVDISVYTDVASWDFDVKLLNNRSSNVNYEYWTCTTLAPGSDPEDTGTPLNSEIVIPAEQYFAGWSPGAWIGGINSIHNMDDIDYLFEWDDMGIAYAQNFNGTYWGVLNHENNEGVFRLSANTETKGLKLWTWGKNNIDNNLYDYSNGGADNYIELWAGVSNAFFRDATLLANQEKSWKETYCATTGLSSILNINEHAAANITWDPSQFNLTYELNTFHAQVNYDLTMSIMGTGTTILLDKPLIFQSLGNKETVSLTDLSLENGDYMVTLELADDAGQTVFQAQKTITIENVLTTRPAISDMKIHAIGSNRFELVMPEVDTYQLRIVNLDGRSVYEAEITGSSYELNLPNRGIYVFVVRNDKVSYTKKVLIK